MEIGEPETRGLPLEWEQETTMSESIDSDERPSAQEPSQSFPAWQAELAERVQEYRQRRSRFNKNEETGHKTLELDFNSPGSKTEETRPNVLEFPSAEKSESRPNRVPEEPPDPHTSALENLEFETEPKGNRINPTTSTKRRLPAETGPLEIDLDSSLGTTPDEIGEGENAAGSVASLGTRFVAGVIDGLILISGAVIYGLIYWRTGGRFALQPLDIAVAGVIAVFFLVLYFAGCTALASATPGLMWAGLEVRTFEGNPPTPAECFWRAFGYLVSMSALMLGFVWAVVDADGLTWHDRMSRTFVNSASEQ